MNSGQMWLVSYDHSAALMAFDKGDLTFGDFGLAVTFIYGDHRVINQSLLLISAVRLEQAVPDFFISWLLSLRILNGIQNTSAI